MTTATEMFEALGYEKPDMVGPYQYYVKHDEDSGDMYYIYFNGEDYTWGAGVLEGESTHVPAVLDEDDTKAVLKRLRELGWMA